MKISEAVVLLTHDINSISIECANKVTEFYTSNSDKIVTDNDFGSIISNKNNIMSYLIACMI